MNALLLALASSPNPVAQDANPIAAAIEAKRLELVAQNTVLGPGDVVEVELPAGESLGISIQGGEWGWTPLAEVEPWWGQAMLELRGHPAGTVILPAGGDGWGQSLSIFPSPGWDGRVHFRDLTIYASGGNALHTGDDDADPVPLKDVRFTDCQFLDHPDPAIRCYQPVSLHQTSIHFNNCIWDLPNSREHAVYNRNAYGLCTMKNSWVKACGAQVWQESNRPAEGPYYPGGQTILSNNLFQGYHRDPERSGSAITLAGSGRDLLMYENIVLDVERPDGEESYGGFVAWSSDTGYTLEGTPIYPGDPILPGQYTNGDVWLVSNLFIQKEPNKDVLKGDSCRSFFLLNNGIFGERPVRVIYQVAGDGALAAGGIDLVLYGANNKPGMVLFAEMLGIDPELLIDPPLYFWEDEIGVVSDMAQPIVADL